MSDGVQRDLRLALRMMLKPLVKLLINQGVTHADFAEAAKDVYVETAIRHFTDGNRVNQSRIAVLTGLTRKEVKNVLVRASGSESHGKGFSRPSKVLLGWHSDPKFVSPYGIPLELPYDGVNGESTFKSLAKIYGADMAPRQLLEVLLSSGAITQTEPGRFKARRRSFEPTALSPQLLERFGDVAHNFFSTAAKNVEKTSQGEALFERVVSANRPLSPEAIKNLNLFIKEKGQELLEQIDNWIVTLDDETTQDQSIETERKDTGLGMYHYVENKGDKSSLKDLLIERELEIKEEQSDN